LARALPPVLRESFVLTGGTALAAFYLGHRHSEDLDFFALELAQPIPFSGIASALAGRFDVVTSERIYDRCLFVVEVEGSALKVEFAPLYFPRLHPPEARGGVLVDSLEDIAANKILAMADRFDPKDFVDVYCLCRDRAWSVLDLVDLARRKHDAAYEYSLRLSRIVEQPDALAAVRLAESIAREVILGFFRSAEAEMIRHQQARLAGRLPPGPGSPDPVRPAE
jgi:predicted nucleotidyltransferase component of viral defense system